MMKKEMNEEGFDEEKARFHLEHLQKLKEAAEAEAEELKLKMNRKTFCHTRTYPPLLLYREIERENCLWLWVMGLFQFFCFIGFVASVACLYRTKVMKYFGFETERESLYCV